MNNNENKTAKPKNIHAGHRERMRNRFLNNGINVFDDYQALEFLMFYVHKRKDTNELGHALIDEFKTLEGVFSASYEDLLTVDGIGSAGAMLINFIGQLRNKIVYDSMTTERIKLDSTVAIAHYCMDCLRHLSYERLIMLCINDNRELISRDIISEGVVNATAVNTRRILELALRRNASGIILSHNHPGGNSHPSNNDIIFTNTIIDSLSGMNISVIDHIICGESDFCSTFERGFLKTASRQ